jgi:hypothetical protein
VYTPSPEGEAIRARLGFAADSNPGRQALPDTPRFYTQIAEYTVSLRICDSTLREAIEQRFELCSAAARTVALELTAVDYPTEDTDLLLFSPFRTVMAKRRGMVYFGVQDTETLSVLAGSLGMADGANSAATEIDCVQCLIEAEIMTALGLIAPEIDFVHAASLSRHGFSVLLVGPSGSGKTTLSVAAAGRGFELLGDDVACVDLKRRVAYSYPRKPRPRSAALPMLARLGGEFQARIAMGRESTIAAVCFLGGFASLPKLTPLRGIDAVWSFSRHIFQTGRPSAPTIVRVAELFTALPCYELLVGGLEDTLSMLEIMTESAATVARK